MSRATQRMEDYGTPQRRVEVDRLQAEIAAGAEPVAVPLAGETVHVLPVRDWRASALAALKEGDFITWAEKCLTEDSRETWDRVDPTIGEIEAFFTAWNEESGQSTGESSASQPSSRGTATRSKRTSSGTTKRTSRRSTGAA